MSKDNVLKFPGGITEEELQNKSAEEMQKLVERMENNRHEGQAKLGLHLTRIKDMRQAGRSTDTLLEETEIALNAALASLEGLNQFCDLISKDIAGIMQSIENQAMGGYSTSLHLEALINVLLESSVIKDESMQKAFEQAKLRMQASISKPS